jgi:uncharacterized RDD family membrane protein YckC
VKGLGKVERNRRLEEWKKLYNESSYAGQYEELDHSGNPEEYYHEDEEEDFIGFRKRFYAFVFDGLLLSILFLEIPNFYLLFMLVSLYYAVMTASPLKGTVGKLAIGAVVVDSKGEQLSFMRALLRFYAYFVSCAICMLGFILILFDVQKKSLHDFMCHTCVVNKRIIDSRLK